MAAPTNNNTLTNLIPDAYAALDVVSRELVGFIPTVARDPKADRVAVGQTLRSSVAPANTAGADIVPAMAIPAAANQTIGNKSLTITKSRFFPFSWSGEDSYAVDQGPGFLTIKQDQIAQALRAAVNEVEADVAAAASAGASRAWGTTADTAPIIGDFSNAKKILDDNGAPGSDRHCVLNTGSGVAVRGFSNLYKVNEGGDTTLLRQGLLGDLYGFSIRESAQVVRPTAGTMASATSSSAAFTVGQTVIPLATAGTGVVAAGDIVVFANDTNKYVVSAVSFAGANPASGDTITLAQPGLRIAQGVATRTITVFGTSSRNCAFSRNAIVLATRLPMTPEEGDMAIDRQVITDPRSGLSFEIAMYPGFRMNTYHVSLAWGVTVFKPEHLAIIIGESNRMADRLQLRAGRIVTVSADKSSAGSVYQIPNPGETTAYTPTVLAASGSASLGPFSDNRSYEINSTSGQLTYAITDSAIRYDAKSSITSGTMTDTATVTVANIITGIIKCTPTAAATYTLPTGAVLDAGLPSSFAIGDTTDFALVNVATDASFDITVATAASGTTCYGSLVVESNSAATVRSSGIFRLIKTAAATYDCFRIA